MERGEVRLTAVQGVADQTGGDSRHRRCKPRVPCRSARRPRQIARVPSHLCRGSHASASPVGWLKLCATRPEP
eukprot:7127753-Prymnesium_polylepis.1